MLRFRAVGALVAVSVAMWQGQGVGVTTGTYDGAPVVVLRLVAPDSQPVTVALSPAQADSAAALIASLGTPRATTHAHTFHGPRGSVTLRRWPGTPLEVTLDVPPRRSVVLLSDHGAVAFREMLLGARR